MYKKIRDKEYDSIGEVSVMLLILIGVLNLFLIALAPEAIAILAPPAYYEAIWVIPPVSMSVFFMFMYSLFANFEFYYEKTKLMMVASVSGAALNIFCLLYTSAVCAGSLWTGGLVLCDSKSFVYSLLVYIP